MSKSVSRGPAPVKRNKVIVALRKAKRATSAELGVPTAYMHSLLRTGFVAVAGKAENKEGKGRKPVIWKLSPKGNGKASALLRHSA